jgi:N-methylhydantoinase A
VNGGLSIAVDVGGTFTDIITEDEKGTLSVLKVPTSKNPATAVAEGLARLGGEATGVEVVSHATTIATNALLTHSGLGRTALITNEGFRDVLEIGRQRRPELYNLRTRRPTPLVSRRDRFTVRCRVAADGSVLEPVEVGQARAVAKRVVKGRFDAAAVSFLNSYRNPVHETKMRDTLSDEGFNGAVCLSSDVDREYREYERASTTVVNASLVPLVSSYLSDLQASLRRMRIMAPLYVMNSEGGMSTLSMASSRPVSVIESGPAAGVLGAAHLAKELSLENAITFDMGGTTAKAGTIIGGEPEIVTEFEAAGRTHSGRSIRGSGYAVRGSFIDLAEVSAGGGSIAYADEGGALAVGPRSAGAEPGPACYGKGGTEPTVTDANVVLGRINPTYLLGGEMLINSDLAMRSISKLARQLGLSATEAAEGVVRLVNDSMSKAISIVSTERGRDPRSFALISFGGAGPLHTCDLAEELGIRDVVVPRHAGLFSARGLLEAELTRTFSLPATDSSRSAGRDLTELAASAGATMKSEGFERFTLSMYVECRYEGQSHELLVPYRGDSWLKPEFDHLHTRLYGYSSLDGVEVVNVRVTAKVRRPANARAHFRRSGGKPPARKRTAWLGGKTVAAPVYLRDTLEPLAGGSGPCIIEEYDSTLVVNPGWRWKAEDYGVRLAR